MANETDSPPETLRAATEDNALPLTGVALLGTLVGQDGAAAALVRLPGGSTRRVATGDDIGAGRVVAIDEGALYLERHSHAIKLTMPGS